MGEKEGNVKRGKGRKGRDTGRESEIMVLLQETQFLLLKTAEVLLMREKRRRRTEREKGNVRT